MIEVLGQFPLGVRDELQYPRRVRGIERPEQGELGTRGPLQGGQRGIGDALAEEDRAQQWGRELAAKRPTATPAR